MFRRLALFLLIACLAMPAMAMPLHCAPAPQAAISAGHDTADHDTVGHAGHHGAAPEREAPAIGQHGCIGCVTPQADPAPAPVAPFHAPASLHARETAFPPAWHAGPDTPPPRA